MNNMPVGTALREVLPRLTKNWTNPTVSRRELMEALAPYGIMSCPNKCQVRPVGRGLYDISHLREDTSISGKSVSLTPVFVPTADERTDEEIEQTILDRFETLDTFAMGIAKGTFRSLILSGPPGIGKTYNVEAVLDSQVDESPMEYQKYTGYSRATGLYKALYQNREDNQVIMFDEMDSVFDDVTSLNLLKGALQSHGRRFIHWRSERVMELNDGEEVPDEFEYKGRIIFVTNKDLQRNVSHKLQEHTKALISRSFYIDLNLSFPREVIIRVRQVVRDTAILDGYTAKQKKLLVDFMAENVERLQECSLRMLQKLAQLLRSCDSNESTFKMLANASCMR